MKLNKLSLSLLILTVLPVIAFSLQIGSLLPQNVIAFQGSTNVSVPIWLSNNDSVLGVEFQFNHSQYFIFRGIEPTSRMSDAALDANAKDSKSVLVAGLAFNNITAGNGVVMNLLFDVNSTAPLGLYTNKIDDLLVISLNEDDVTVSVSDGTFLVI